ncbi:NAD(P)/FAD-dependent oxidoreductase [Candidatus Omnitrophota bacterium]
MDKVDILIIGAGVVGLSIARELADKGDLLVVEKHESFGKETSSRNSEIIHAGIYYEPGSLKARFCIEGRRLLYEFCQENNIAHKRLGKLIVATDDSEIKRLETLFENGKGCGVDDLKMIDADEIKRLEPNISAIAAIYSPSTGILDTHQFMKQLESHAKGEGVTFAYNCEVIGFKKNSSGYAVAISDIDGERLDIEAKVVINCAGLDSDKIAQMAGIDIDKEGYKLYPNKGEYFRLSNAKAKLINHLIYPTPTQTSLGIHTVSDLGGQIRLGPSSFYVDEIDYDVDPKNSTNFFNGAKKFLPFLEEEDLSVDTAGIRPKLQAPGSPSRDFIIQDEAGKDLPGFINLVGIESPGLTATLSIAKYIATMV